MQETKKFNKSISFPMNDFVEIKGGRRLKCLNIPWEVSLNRNEDKEGIK